MRKRPLVVTACAVAILAGTLIARGGFGSASNSILRTPFSLENLEVLFHHGSTRGVIDRLASRYAVWLLPPGTEHPDGEEGCCGFRMGFASRAAASAKGVLVDFAVTRTPGEDDAARVDAAVVEDLGSPPIDRPTFPTIEEVRAFRALLRHPPSYDALESILRQDLVYYMALVRTTDDQLTPDERIYDLLAYLSERGKAGPIATIRLRYDMAADAITHVARLD